MLRSLLLGLALLAGSATAQTITLGDDRLPTTLLKPDGDGPFPAIVLMHDCSGLGPSSSGAPGRWAKQLLSQGYVVILPDSFSTRGFANGICTDASKRRFEVRPFVRARDARAARAFLRELPYVDKERIGLMGGSHGGFTTLVTLSRPGSGFAAAVALYPRCQFSQQLKPDVPLLILIGELDDWTPAKECVPLAGGNVSVKVYPGVHHSFDGPRPKRYVAERINPSSPSGHGATTEGNADAWADSIRQVSDFFAKNLKR
jgi:dienelactone hydrolase